MNIRVYTVSHKKTPTQCLWVRSLPIFKHPSLSYF